MEQPNCIDSNNTETNAPAAFNSNMQLHRHNITTLDTNNHKDTYKHTLYRHINDHITGVRAYFDTTLIM